MTIKWDAYDKKKFIAFEEIKLSFLEVTTNTRYTFVGNIN